MVFFYIMDRRNKKNEHIPKVEVKTKGIPELQNSPDKPMKRDDKFFERGDPIFCDSKPQNNRLDKIRNATKKVNREYPAKSTDNSVEEHSNKRLPAVTTIIDNFINKRAGKELKPNEVNKSIAKNDSKHKPKENEILPCKRINEEPKSDANENVANNKCEEESKSKIRDVPKKEPVKKNIENNFLHMDERRKMIREKYTFRMKGFNKDDLKRDDGKVVPKNNVKNAENIQKELIEENTQTEELNPSTISKVNDARIKNSDDSRNRKPDREAQAQRRKPIIKTVMSKAGNMRIYKAVTFVDRKNETVTPLQIKIPTGPTKTQKVSKFTDTQSLKSKTTVSRVSIPEKRIGVRRKKEQKKYYRKNRHVPSSDGSIRKETLSPTTEVAKWAPSCLDKLTKPYYEAWVDTTLAAISKDKHFDCHSFLQNFQRALKERPDSSDLTYQNFQDERYTGRIRINHK